nr:ATP synthase F0 subunit 8 [Heteropoda venatoria]WCS92216.1 ATP synthase F0 subunit 8 [Heteropoda venatoria]
MPLFWVFSTIMTMWIVMFLVGLYFYILNDSIFINKVHNKGSQVIWWW